MPLTTLARGQTVIIHHRTVSGQDDRHNDTYTTVDETITGCAVSYAGGTEVVAGTDTVASDATVYSPVAGTPPVTAYDSMTLPDGNTYEIQGAPDQQTSPFSGLTSYVEIHGRLVTGASV